MKIVFAPQYKAQLLSIIAFIAKDKKTAATDFKNELQFKISQLKTYPKIYRQSIYSNDENIRDLIFKGYTIVYEIKKNQIDILDIFKWIDKE
ncbi:MAG: type II toxin-antitoxin system RelE/ParE family toxin [Sulfurimonadaceae bacterium]|jgi:plasmid stabilization system protein ParE|nr:type II toxin-antitoxin system RelE/ParE family toxin [Sulfurimonadaceae bacterium]